MPETRLVPVKNLRLDLKNFRTVPQNSELEAAQALIAVNLSWFWSLMDSLLTTGYLPTENIIVLKNKSEMVVREGNRRTAALKIILGHLPLKDFSVPADAISKIRSLSDDWIRTNEQIPCLVYDIADEKLVRKIVDLTHGKGEKAGRVKWSAVARARYNRDISGSSEPALTQLELYLNHGKNLTDNQKDSWAGDFPITVLAATMGKVAPNLSAQSPIDLSKKYPNIPNKDIWDDIIHKIGTKSITFPSLRSVENGKDFKDRYFGKVDSETTSTSSPSTTGNASTAGSSQSQSSQGTAPNTASGSPQNASSGNQATAATGAVATPAIRDPRAVRELLNNFKPIDHNRQKVVTLRDEALSLDLIASPKVVA